MSVIELPMSLEAATRRALAAAKRDDCDMFVVWEDGSYHVASAFDLDTFYLGLEPVRVCCPDGLVDG